MSLNVLKWSMSVIISDSGSSLAARFGDGLRQRVVEILAVGERGERIGQALVAHGFEIVPAAR